MIDHSLNFHPPFLLQPHKPIDELDFLIVLKQEVGIDCFDVRPDVHRLKLIQVKSHTLVEFLQLGERELSKKVVALQCLAHACLSACPPADGTANQP